MSYTSERAWSDQYIPAIKQIVGPHLMVESSFEVDTENATDLVIMKAKNMMVACRLRKPGYAERYPYEFTIRSKLDSGYKTELEKITQGFADWMFYGHVNDAGEVWRWYLIDLQSWRYHFMWRNKRKLLYGEKSNGDGTHFTWFDLRYFPKEPNILVASSHIVASREVA